MSDLGAPATGTEPAGDDAALATAVAVLYRAETTGEYGAAKDLAAAVVEAVRPVIVTEERAQIAAKLAPFLESIASWFDDLATADVPDIVGHQAAVRAGQIRDRTHLLSHGERPL